MRIRIFVWSILLQLNLILLLTNNLFAQLYQEIDPTVANIEIVRGSGDPGYNGTLDMKIPLMKIPGTGGLDFNLDLIYVNGNGVPASESESWVGLGWNLNMYQITCSPAFLENVYQSPVGTTGGDLYYLTCPGISTPIYRFGNEQWLPLNWSAIKIESVDDPNPNTTGWSIDKDYKKFVVTDVNGTRYIFEHRLCKDSEVTLRNHCANNANVCLNTTHNTTHNHPYYYVFKLTAILGANYIDGSSTPDNTPGNGGTDQGDWIKLDYSTIETVSGIGAPANSLKMEMSYLSKITTPTHTASFTTTSDLSICSRFIYQGRQYDNLKLLKTIQLNPEGTTVEFFYTPKFAWAKLSADFYYTLVKQEGYGDKLRAGLDSVHIANSSLQPAYKFEYNDNPGEANGAVCFHDPWGYYSSESPANGLQTKYTWDCWMLKKVTYPTGGTVAFEFESNRFQTYYGNAGEGDDERIGGGVRLKTQTLTNPVTDPPEVSTYSYKYSLTNPSHPEHGFISFVPLISTEDYANITVQGGFIKNLRTDVHYPDIQITQPDGSRICRYYTCAFSESAVGPDKTYGYYYRSFLNVAVESDNYLSAIDVCSGSNNHLYSGLYAIFKEFNASKPNIEYSHYSKPDQSYISTENPPGFYHENDAFKGEASEFGDKCIATYTYGGTYYNPLFDNSWKRGYLTCEEFYYDNTEYPVQKKMFHYTMTPIQSEIYEVRVVKYDPYGLSIFFSPCFVTSGWVKQTAIVYNSAPYVDWYTSPQIAKVERFEYNNINGLVSKKSVSQDINAYQKQMTFHAYACDLPDIYPAMNTLHMWSQEAFTAVGDQTSTFSTTLTGNHNISSLTQTTWQNNNGMWLPYQTLKWKDSNGNKNYDASDENIAAQVFTSYDAQGNPTEFIDASGTPTSVKWGYNASKPIATFVNGKNSETYFCNFESQNGWDNAMNQYPAEGHSGVYCGQIDNSTSSKISSYNNTGLTISLTSPKKFRYSAWVYSYGPSVDLYLIMKRAGETGNYTYVDHVSTAATNQWTHIEGEYQVTADVETLRLRLDNNGNGIVLYDDTALYPSDALMYTGTYDPSSLLLSSVSDANGNPKKFEYDELQRLRRVISYDDENLQEYEYELVGNLISPSRLNSITSRQIRSLTDCTTTIEYFDGLGRKRQSQIQLGSEDLISALTLDPVGRVSRSYKPYQINLGVNAHKYDPAFHDHSKSYYNQTLGITTVGDFPYSETVYWNDPLGRPKMQGNAGDAFKIGSGKEIVFGYYQNGNLFTVSQTDENGNQVSTTTNHLENTVQTAVDPVTGGLNFITTFEYDILGNLLKSVPPNGNATGGDPVATATTHTYNTLSQLIQKKSPDAGIVQYLYDKNGNLRFMQDAKQSPDKFTYQKYDALNRIIEIGEYTGSASFVQFNADYATFPLSTDGNRTIDRVLSYDVLTFSGQNNLKGHVAKSVSYRQGTAFETIHYSYDNLGRVEWMIYTDLGASSKQIKYWYDLQGNVTKKGFIDQGNYANNLYTFNDYDQAGRLWKVYTDRNENGTNKVKEAEYSYFPSGQVKRLQLGNAQGVDYRYNERDWLKSINNQNLSSSEDPGGDGANGIAVDKFGEVIGYNIVSEIGTAQNVMPQHNGNISWLMYNISGANFTGSSGTTPLVGWTYTYDKANRLTKADFGYCYSGWKTTAAYDLSTILFDANGNILSLYRNNKSGNPLDRFSYSYQSGTNWLTSITNTVSGTKIYSYAYDANGSVTADGYHAFSNMNYNIHNLPEQITKSDGNIIDYWYDANGGRIRKQISKSSTISNDEIYILGADGQTEAVYNNRSGLLKFWNIIAGGQLIGRIEKP